MRKLPLLCVYLALAAPCAARIITVDDDGPADFNNIQAAIDDSNDGDVVVVFPGTYTGTGNRDIDFLGKAITVRSVNPNNPNIVAATIIDCNGTEMEPHRGFYFHGEEDANCILAGFIIIRGYGSDEQIGEDVRSAGGAVYCRNSNPRIAQCVIKDSYAALGGGIFCDSSSPTLINCTISGNWAFEAGGGLYNVNANATVRDCNFADNWAADDGGAMYNSNSDPNVTGCTFSSNDAGDSTGNDGGGMYNYYSNPTVANCTFSENRAATYGGGMYNYYSNPTVANCAFSENRVGSNGAGMSNTTSSPTVSNCTFRDNWAGFQGAGMYNIYDSDINVSRCTFSGNWTDDGGGGMWNYQSDPNVVECTFSNNWADHSGGGMANYFNRATVTKCTFSSNGARSGGGLYCFGTGTTATVTYCVFIGNKASVGGGGMFNDYGSSSTVTNCTFSSNSAVSGSGLLGDVSTILSNCIVWDDPAISGPGPIVTYSDVRGGRPGLGNIDADPCFVEPGKWVDANDPNVTVEPNDANAVWVDGDYHLKSEGWYWDSVRRRWDYDEVTSRCIDAGNPGSPFGGELLTIPDDPGHNWGINLRINMGAYGGTPQASMPPYDWALLADITNDGIVDGCDYAHQAPYWLALGTEQPGDFNRNGIVDTYDLGLFVADWLNTTTWHE